MICWWHLAAFDKEQDSLNFLIFLSNRYPNINLQQKTIPSLFLVYSFQVSIIKISHFKHHKSTNTELLINFKIFTSFSYKISLIECLMDRLFKICNNWNSFHNDFENIKSNLIKNVYLPLLIHKVIKTYLNYKFSSNPNQFITLNYDILTTFHTISKINFWNFKI